MTKEQLDEIRKRADAATPGPWTPGLLGRVIPVLPNDDNAKFICAARTDIPALLAEVERLQHALDKMNVASCGIMVEQQDYIARLEARCEQYLYQCGMSPSEVDAELAKLRESK